MTRRVDMATLMSEQDRLADTPTAALGYMSHAVVGVGAGNEEIVLAVFIHAGRAEDYVETLGTAYPRYEIVPLDEEIEVQVQLG